jgi:hypothetical protein
VQRAVVLPFFVTGVALPLTTSDTAAVRNARRLSSRGLGRSSIGAAFRPATAAGAGSVGGAAVAEAGSMIPTLVTIAEQSHDHLAHYVYLRLCGRIASGWGGSGIKTASGGRGCDSTYAKTAMCGKTDRNRCLMVI